MTRRRQAISSAPAWASRRRSAAIALAVAVVYLGLAQYVLWLNDPVNSGAGFWPAAGVSLAGMLLVPTRHWWMVAAAVGASDLGGDLVLGYDLFVSSCWALANALEPVLGAAAVRRYAVGDGRLTSPRNVTVFALGAAVLAPALAAVVGSLGTVTAFDKTWLQVWPKWVAGDGLGVLVMAPPILAWRDRRGRSALETAVLCALVLAGTGLGFRNWDASWDAVAPYLTLPALLWAAARFGAWGAALAVCVTANAANVATAHGYGPFALQAGPDSHAVTLLQIFLGITVVTSLLLAALAANLTERVDVERMLAHEAAHDHLTGLPNRRELARRLDVALHEDGSPHGVALLYLDLDRFKVVNDSLGHDWGDALLTTIAGRLRAGARPQDVVARIGGDEFVVLCTHLDEPAEAGRIAQRLLHAVNEPVHHEGRTVEVSASIGIATTDGRSVTADEMLRDADAAMYRAKRDGRARVEFFDAELRREAVRRMQVEVELRAALATDQLEVHYQPVLEASTGRVVALEALVRWRHPRRGLLLPGEFLDVAEDSGLICALGDRVMARAISDVARLPDPDVCVAVNISASQIQERGGRGLDEVVLDTCAAMSVDPRRVWLELTEEVGLDRPRAVQVLRRLHHAGVRLALDDFGTGYASISQLERVPFDLVKIDRSFTAGLETDADAQSRIAAIVSLIRAFRMTPVTEGIETPEQEAVVRLAGCELVQGFLYGYPAPLPEVAAAVGALIPLQAHGPLDRAPGDSHRCVTALPADTYPSSASRQRQPGST